MGNGLGQPKKPFYKRWWFIVLAVLVVISLALDSEDDAEVDEVSTHEEAVLEAEEVEEIDALEDSEVVAEDERPDLDEGLADTEELEDVPTEDLDASEDELVALMLYMLQNSYSDTGDVTFIEEDKMFTITPTENSIGDAVIYARAGETTVLASWEELVKSTIEVQSNLEEVLGNEYILNVVNPYNVENTIIMVGNGIVYDAVSGEYTPVNDY